MILQCDCFATNVSTFLLSQETISALLGVLVGFFLNSLHHLVIDAKERKRTAKERFIMEIHNYLSGKSTKLMLTSTYYNLPKKICNSINITELMENNDNPMKKENIAKKIIEKLK